LGMSNVAATRLKTMRRLKNPAGLWAVNGWPWRSIPRRGPEADPVEKGAAPV